MKVQEILNEGESPKAGKELTQPQIDTLSKMFMDLLRDELIVGNKFTPEWNTLQKKAKVKFGALFTQMSGYKSIRPWIERYSTHTEFIVHLATDFREQEQLTEWKKENEKKFSALVKKLFPGLKPEFKIFGTFTGSHYQPGISFKIKATKIVKEGEVIQGNFGKKKDAAPVEAPKAISVLQAFGSEEMNILHDAGIHFVEKAAYWSELDKPEGKYKPITQIMFKKVEKELAKHGFKLAVLKAKDIYGGDPTGPMQRYSKKPHEQCYVLEMGNGDRFLCDTTGANTYTRMWAMIA